VLLQPDGDLVDMSGQPQAGPFSAVVGPQEGESLWQPLPSRGYVTMKLGPANTPYDGFTAGIQVLPPGCHVRDHGHRQNHELIFIHQGSGVCTIESRATPIEPGSTVLFGRNAVHRIENTGSIDMHMFWVFFPPGLEDWFRAIGRVRAPGEPMPEGFPRPEDVREIQERMRFVIPDAKR
jgi:mannose-6-phosphate isomerase-like protein (cupin superfamily)